jgi:hypothetical protein
VLPRYFGVDTLEIASSERSGWNLGVRNLGHRQCQRDHGASTQAVGYFYASAMGLDGSIDER